MKISVRYRKVVEEVIEVDDKFEKMADDELPWEDYTKLRKELFKDIGKKTECDYYEDIIDAYSEDTGELLYEWN